MGIDLLQGFEADDVDAASGFRVVLSLGKIHVLLQRVSFLCCQLQPSVAFPFFSSVRRNYIFKALLLLHLVRNVQTWL